MDSNLFHEWKLILSENLNRLLDKPEAQEYIITSFQYTHPVFTSILERVPEEVRKALRLDVGFLTTALQSAYLDLWQSDNFHELKDGPSPEKHGAAITCWINRMCPVQIIDDCDKTIITFVNSIFAIEVGWAVMWQMKEGITAESTPEQACSIIKSVIMEDKRRNGLIYALMWRNPSYRELITLFEFLS